MAEDRCDTGLSHPDHPVGNKMWIDPLEFTDCDVQEESIQYRSGDVGQRKRDEDAEADQHMGEDRCLAGLSHSDRPVGEQNLVLTH